ncbi:MAG: anhydro-N-acetylmuramic acid kinase, partial [Proteobacteria bacterium]|nr:anhydro-N-acetylmuramic acid kinase [Pseudomonadota bacterium]
MHPKISKSPSKPQPTKPIAILGMMSGTSVDGIDGAVVISDGVSVERTGCTASHEWHPKTRSRIFTTMEEMQASSSPASLLGRAEYTALAQTIAEEHAHLAKHLITHYGKPIKLIGFHGQTILHRPAERLSLQLGDAKTLAQATGIKTV